MNCVSPVVCHCALDILYKSMGFFFPEACLGSCKVNQRGDAPDSVTPVQHAVICNVFQSVFCRPAFVPGGLVKLIISLVSVIVKRTECGCRFCHGRNATLLSYKRRNKLCITQRFRRGLAKGSLRLVCVCALHVAA